MAITRRRVSKPDPPASEEEEMEVEEQEEEASESRVEGGEEEEGEGEGEGEEGEGEEEEETEGEGEEEEETEGEEAEGEEEEAEEEEEGEGEGEGEEEEEEGEDEGEEDAEPAAGPVPVHRSADGKFAKSVWSEADEIRILTALASLEKKPKPNDLEALFAEMKSSFADTVSESSFKDKVRRLRTKYWSIDTPSPEQKVFYDLASKVWGPTTGTRKSSRKRMAVEAPSFSVLLDQDEKDLTKDGGCLRPSKLKKFQEAWRQLRVESNNLEKKRLKLKTKQMKAFDRATKRAKKL